MLLIFSFSHWQFILVEDEKLSNKNTRHTLQLKHEVINSTSLCCSNNNDIFQLLNIACHIYADKYKEEENFDSLGLNI